jgi:hypothetical protein
MAGKSKVVPLSEPLKWAHEYLVIADQEQASKAIRERLRDGLKPYIMANCTADENGNYILTFPSPVTTDGEIYYRGLMAQRRVSEFTDEDKVRELIVSKGLESRCIKEVVVEEYDLDELYAANQEGIVSDEEIDAIIVTNVTYSLNKIKQ